MSKAVSRDALVRRLNRYKSEYNILTTGTSKLVPRAKVLREEIMRLNAEIKRLDRDAAERLALGNLPIDKTLAIVAIPLLADVLNDVVAEVDGTLRQAGCQDTVFSDYTAVISKTALKIVDTLAMSEAGLPDLLSVDDTLVDAIRKKIMTFLKQRLNIEK